MKKVTKFVAADGKEFDSADAASRHEDVLSAEAALSRVLTTVGRPNGRPETWLRRILANASEVREVLNVYLGRLPTMTVVGSAPSAAQTPGGAVPATAVNAAQPEAAAVPAATAAFSEPSTNVTEAA